MFICFLKGCWTMQTKKDNVYNWIILLVILLPLCFITAKGIDFMLISSAGTPLYTNLYRTDNLDLSIKLPKNWTFSLSEDSLAISDEGTNESITISRMNNTSSMETAKSMFLLELENKYNNLEHKEDEISTANTRIYYTKYVYYTDFYVDGVLENNGIFIRFTYKTPYSNPEMIPLNTILNSIYLSEIPETNTSVDTNTPQI